MVIKKITEKSIYIFEKKRMRKFVCGDIKFKKISYMSKELLIPNKKFDKELWSEKKIIYKNNFGVNKNIHGFSGIMLGDKIAYTFHTSQHETIWNNIDFKNIEIGEAHNPIKFVNPIQIMSIKDFFKYYKITDPDSMLSNFRYGNNKLSDMAYCSLRALAKSLSSTEKPMLIEMGEQKIYTKDFFTNDKESQTVLTPAQTALKEIEFEKIKIFLVEEIYKDMHSIEKNKITKDKLLDKVRDNGKELADLEKYINV